MITQPKISEYIERHSTGEDQILYELNRETHLKVLNPNMLSGQVQGKLLEFISRMVSPKYILEIGTYTGYSAICLAKGLCEGGKLVTIEINDELVPIITRYLESSGMSPKVELITGNAVKIVPGLPYQFELAYIDGDKTEYLDYYEMVLQKLSSGGFMLINNVLWDGKVLDKSDHNADTKHILKLNEHIKNDKRVENVILPLRDGINVVRKI